MESLCELGDGLGEVRKSVKETNVPIAPIHVVGNLVSQIIVGLLFGSCFDSNRTDSCCNLVLRIVVGVYHDAFRCGYYSISVTVGVINT